MGFNVESDIYKLVFVEPEFEGLVIRARSIPIRDLVKISAASNLKITPLLSNDEWEQIRELARIFADALVDWNLEVNGEPVPTTVDGLLSLPLRMFWKIQGAWWLAIAGVSAPLDDASSGGDPSLEESMPMETLS